MQGIIIKGIGGFYYVRTAEGIYECKARGVFRKNKIVPLAGDVCEIVVSDNMKGNVTEISPRKNELVRPPIANIDNIFIVMAAAEPDPVMQLIDKLTVIAAKSEIKPYIVINKTDLSDNWRKIYDIYKSAGFEVFAVSAAEKSGVEDIIDCMTGKISVFAGCSGVGKSSILNLILPDAELKTGQISQKISRGKHTTREVELIELPNGGYIADSPGFSSLEIEDVDCELLEQYFPEFEPYLGNCRFRGCAHVSEPDCAVKAAVSKGKIAESRYASYTDLYNTFKEIKKWQK